MSAPFDFSGRDSLQSRLLPSVIQQKLGQQSAEEAARRRQQEDNFRLAVRLTTEKGLNPAKISPFLQLDRGQEDFLGELFRVQQEEKKIAAGGEQLRGLSALPEQTPVIQEATRGVFGGLEQLGPSAAERGMRERRTGALEREEFLQNRQLTIQKEQKLAREGFARQRTKEDENLGVDRMATQIAFEKIGEADATTFEQRVNQFRDQGFPPGRSIELVIKATALSLPKASELTLKIRSTEGLTQEEIRARDKLDEWADEMGADFLLGEFTIDQLKRKARMEVAGDLQHSLYARTILGELVFVPTAGSVDQKNYMESQQAQIQLMKMKEEMVGNFQAMREAKKNGELGLVGIPFFGQWYVDFLTRAGAVPKAAAAYQVSMFAFISFMLKAIQGARPSDFDLRMFLSQAPAFTEVMSGSADAKIHNLEMQSRIGLAARLSKEDMGRIIRQTEIPWSKEDDALRDVWYKWIPRLGGQDFFALSPDEQQRVYAELQDSMDLWIGTGRQPMFRSPGVGDGSETKLENLSLDELNMLRRAQGQPVLPPPQGPLLQGLSPGVAP